MANHYDSKHPATIAYRKREQAAEWLQRARAAKTTEAAKKAAAKADAAATVAEAAAAQPNTRGTSARRLAESARYCATLAAQEAANRG